MDWREEYNRCREIATENFEAGSEQGYSYWTDMADCIQWLGESIDRNIVKQLVQHIIQQQN